MRTIKATLKINKNGRLFCTTHQTYRVSVRPSTGCKICWLIYETSPKQLLLDDMNKILEDKKERRKLETNDSK